MKVSEAVAPAAVDCLAEPPLHPQLESLFVHAPVKVTAASESSTRTPAPGIVGGGGVGGVDGGGVVTGPEELSPPPPPPHETSRLASNNTRTRVMYRFIGLACDTKVSSTCAADDLVGRLQEWRRWAA